MKRALAILLFLAGLPAHAATFVFEAEVTSVSATSDAVYPGIGAPATIELWIDDTDLTKDLIDPITGFPNELVRVDFTAPGISAQLDRAGFDPSFGTVGVRYEADGLFFSAYSPFSVSSPGTTSFFAEGLQSFGVTFDPLPNVPTTVGELLMALESPTGGFFDFEADLSDGGFDFVRTSIIAPSAVPLPAGASLLLIGLAAFGVAARRKSKASNS